jgi:group I intron endonuclease
MEFGVYVIRNIVTNKIYVGSTGKLSERWNQHKYSLKRGKHSNPHLQSAWNKYGEKSFTYEIIEICSVGESFKKRRILD